MKKILYNLILLIFSTSNYLISQNTISFEEKFNDNKRDWYITDQPTSSTSISDGHYRIKINMESGIWKLKQELFIDPSKDFTIEAQMKQVSGISNHGYGIVWGSKDDNNLYTFIVSSDGHFLIYFTKDGKFNEINPWTESKEIKPLGETNILTLKKTSKDWEFFINSKSVYTCSSKKLMGSYSGFVVNNTMTIDVENFLIKQDEASLNIIDKPINGYFKENLGKNINSPFSEVKPTISADGKTLFVSRYHPANEFGESDCDVWYSTLEKGEWTPIKNIGKPINTKGGNSVISISPDGNSLLLINKYNKDGSLTSGGISISYKTVDGWSLPESIEIKNFKNSNQYVSFCMSADNKSLIMAIEPDSTLGDLDLFVSFRTDSGFTAPISLGNKINTFAADMTPFLAADNVTLYYASSGKPGYGSADIFVTRRLDDTWTNWSEPKNMGSEINSPDWDAYFMMPASGEIAYIVSFSNSIGMADIFKIKVPESARPNPMVLVQGKVLNKKTKEPISAAISYYDLSTNKELGTAISNPSDGSYKIVLPYGKKYSFMAKKENYYAISENIDVKIKSKYLEIDRDLLLNPIEIGETIRLNNLFFDIDKATLNSDSYGELDRLVEMLNKNTNLQIGIYGHTDSDGNSGYNKQLSEKRAKAVESYIVSKNIDKSRLKSKGLGKSKPLAKNNDEESKAQNRRVEFVILKK
ncbi:MAG: OmpA family protein [Candidatus Kapabacteria bacterium]|nr:OmpA family protein [Candidatus Kapabacteria bacterium]